MRKMREMREMRETYDICDDNYSYPGLRDKMCDCFQNTCKNSTDDLRKGCVFDCMSKDGLPKDRHNNSIDIDQLNTDISSMNAIFMNRGHCPICPASFIKLPNSNQDNKVCINNDTFNTLLKLALSNCQ
jgi:hypothetical protein